MSVSRSCGVLGSLLLSSLLACSASHADSDEPGHFRSFEGEGSVQITWSIAEHELPPTLEGAAQVLTTAALDTYNAALGALLMGRPVVYEGTLEVDGGEHGALLRSEVTATLVEHRNTLIHGTVYDFVHELAVYGGAEDRRARILQDHTESRPPAQWLTRDGMGAAEIILPPDDAIGGPPRLQGDCFYCMTVLEEPVTEIISLQADAIDPADGAEFAARVEGQLHRVAPEQLTPAHLRGAWLVERAADAAALMDEFVEVEPGRWEREHVQQTYLRCQEGGSRLVDLRTTWRLQQGDLTQSGIGDIEVFHAGPCENFDYGGGS